MDVERTAPAAPFTPRPRQCRDIGGQTPNAVSTPSFHIRRDNPTRISTSRGSGFAARNPDFRSGAIFAAARAG
jgi:hypothetical protein